ncbi:MAG TPA: oligosaccharide flippase family protein [Candidatus Baltobacteraceae bacterium]|nr:oligosaccharide flippase family protein [Candidatus Baltobacteraceae bacterium]
MNALVRRVAASDFTRSSALVFAASLFANFFNYVFYVLMGRLLSVRDYGVVMSLISIVLVVLGLGSIAQTATAKLAADLRAAGDREAMASFSRGITRGSLWLAFAIALVAFGARGFIGNYLHIGNLGLVIVAGATAGIGIALLLQRGLFQGFGSFPTFALSSVLDTLRTAFLVPLVHAFGAMGSLLSFLGAVVVGSVFGELALRRRFGKMTTSARLDVRRMIVIAGATGISSSGILLLMYYDVVLARHFLTPVDAGLYGAAALAGRVIFAIISFLPTVLLPSVAVRFAHGRSSAHMLAAALGTAASVVGALAVVCAIAPKIVIRLLAGANFVPGAPLILPYVLAAGALSVASLLSTYAIARHRFGFVPYLLAVAACEVTAVALRHGSSQQIVQDVVAGHTAVLCVMAIFVVLDSTKTRQPATLPEQSC